MFTVSVHTNGKFVGYARNYSPSACSCEQRAGHAACLQPSIQAYQVREQPVSSVLAELLQASRRFFYVLLKCQGFRPKARARSAPHASERHGAVPWNAPDGKRLAWNSKKLWPNLAVALVGLVVVRPEPVLELRV